jgi:uncharacterized protein YxeA
MAQLNLDVVINTANAANSVGEIRKQLKELKTAMLTVGEDTPEFEKLAAAAARLKDRVEEANEKINALNPDQFKGLQQMATGAATGVQLVTSSMALLGIESEDAQKAMMRVQAAMAFAQAINDVDKLKKGFKAFNDTVKANPIIAVASALVALSVAVYKVYQAQQDANSELAKATREYEKQKEATATLSREYDRQIELLTAQGASTEQIIAVKRKLIEAQIAEAQSSLRVSMLKVEEVKNNDSLWESLLRVADVVNGTNQAEAAIAVNKKERAQEAVDQIKEQQEALKDLQNQLKVLDIEEEKSAQKKSEDSKKAYQERKAQREQEAADNEAAWARELELMAEQKEAADQDEADRAEREEASQRRRMKLYLDDRNEKLKRQKEKDDAEKASAEKAKKLDEMRYSLAIDSAKQTLEAISSLMKNNAKAQKAISASLTLIDTYVAAQKAYASQMAVPSVDAPIRAAIAAGVAVASGLARVAAILRVDTSGGSVTATASGGGGGGTLDFSTQPNVGTSTQPSTLLNEQGQVINQNNDMRPMYVSVQEINDTNTNVRTAEERSRF